LDFLDKGGAQGHPRRRSFAGLSGRSGLLREVATESRAATGHHLALPTLGGRQFWADRYICGGWRIQENVITGHARLLDPDDSRHCRGDYQACRAAFEHIRSARDIAPYGRNLVLLVHGLGRSRASFRGLERGLRQAGHDVAGIGYPSTRRSLAANADGCRP